MTKTKAPKVKPKTGKPVKKTGKPVKKPTKKAKVSKTAISEMVAKAMATTRYDGVARPHDYAEAMFVLNPLRSKNETMDALRSRVKEYVSNGYSAAQIVEFMCHSKIPDYLCLDGHPVAAKRDLIWNLAISAGARTWE